MRALVLTAALLALAVPACAQESQADSGQTAHPAADSGFGTAPIAWRTPVENAGFAKQIERDLGRRGARVAIVFRAGRPRAKLPRDIAYTHGAFWVYGDMQGGDGKTYKGYAVYNLYQGDGKSLPVDQSLLRQDFPLDFISASAEDDVAVIIPSPEMQRRLMAVIASPTYAKMHVGSYSLVSSPFDDRHQNCTEFVLDVVSAAAWQTDDYAQIKANLKAYFTPTVVHANVFERVLGPMLDPRLNLDDQPGEIRTTTYESIAAFMTQNKLMAQTYVLNKSGGGD